MRETGKMILTETSLEVLHAAERDSNKRVDSKVLPDGWFHRERRYVILVKRGWIGGSNK